MLVGTQTDMTVHNGLCQLPNDYSRGIIYNHNMFIVQAAEPFGHFLFGFTFWRLANYTITLPIEQHVFRHQYRKTTVLSCHRCLINTGVEKMNI